MFKSFIDLLPMYVNVTILLGLFVFIFDSTVISVCLTSLTHFVYGFYVKSIHIHNFFFVVFWLSIHKITERHSPGINLRWFSFNFPSIPSCLAPTLVVLFWIYQRGAVFTVCSHTITLLWSRKTSVVIEIFQLSFHIITFTEFCNSDVL